MCCDSLKHLKHKKTFLRLCWSWRKVWNLSRTIWRRQTRVGRNPCSNSFFFNFFKGVICEGCNSSCHRGSRGACAESISKTHLGYIIEMRREMRLKFQLNVHKHTYTPLIDKKINPSVNLNLNHLRLDGFNTEYEKEHKKIIIFYI